MAHIVGMVTTSHIPAIGSAIARGLQNEPYWRPFFDGFAGAHRWLAEMRPDVAVVIYNDHGLNFFLDKMPTFAVGAAAEYRHADEGWGLAVSPPFTGDPDLSWHVIDSLVADEFDIVTCQEMLVDHAFTVPMSLLWPDRRTWPTAVLPIVINTVQHPLPSPKRCFAFGQAIGRALESCERDLRVVVIGTGGLSHQLDGTRAGFINKPFDLQCLDRLVHDPEALTKYSVREVIELAGSQGVELLNLITARATLQGDVAQVHRNYHVPISNTATGLLVVENRAAAVPTAA
jgi:protocatechuate 4,5-dioxygenase beta chain